MLTFYRFTSSSKCVLKFIQFIKLEAVLHLTTYWYSK